MNKKKYIFDLETRGLGNIRIKPTKENKHWWKMMVNSHYGYLGSITEKDNCPICAYMKMMEKYCKQDILLTKEIHERMNPEKQPLSIPTNLLLLVN